MSQRGAEFYGQWVSRNVMGANVGSDIISVADLTARLFAEAKAAKVPEHEIEEEVGSAYEAILAVIAGPQASQTDDG